MAQLGRPPKPPEQRRTEVLRVRLTESEMAFVRDAGDSDWLRDVILRAAGRELRKRS